MTPNVPDPRRWWALALLCGACFTVILDGTIALVSLPSIGADLGFSEQSLQWVLGAYALTSGGLLLVYAVGEAPDVGRDAARTILVPAGSAVLAVTVAIGAIAAQAAVLKVGFRAVAATGMAPIGTGSLVLTQVSHLPGLNERRTEWQGS